MNKSINEMKRRIFDLQLFAEDDSAGGGEDDSAKGKDGQGGTDKDESGSGKEGGSKQDGSDKDDKSESKRTYDDAEVDRIVAKHKKQWEEKHAKDVEDAKKEAEKLAKMNKEQKEQYEQEKKDKLIEQQKAEIDKLKAEANRAELSKSAAQIMKENHEIIATPDMLDFVVGDDAESTKTNIDKLVGIILEDRKAQEEKRARGTTPKNYGTGDRAAENPYTKVANKYKRK